MNLLFINSFLSEDYQTFKLLILVVGIMWLFVIIAIAIDLRSGYAKAKQRGEVRNSYGLRRTASKFTLYFSCLLLALMVDAILMFIVSSFNVPIPVMPYITVLGSGYLIVIEGKSVMENAETKHKRRLEDGASGLLTFLEHAVGKEELKKIVRAMRDKIKLENKKTEDNKNEENE